MPDQTFEPDESNLVQHARRELELCGQTAEDPAFAESLVSAVAAFADYGHSGGSAGVGVAMLNDLLQFRPLSPLTNDPAEWTDVAWASPGVPLWQSKRDPAAFSEDNLKTAYRLRDGGSGRDPIELAEVQA